MLPPRASHRPFLSTALIGAFEKRDETGALHYRLTHWPPAREQGCSQRGGPPFVTIRLGLRQEKVANAWPSHPTVAVHSFPLAPPPTKIIAASGGGPRRSRPRHKAAGLSGLPQLQVVLNAPPPGPVVAFSSTMPASATKALVALLALVCFLLIQLQRRPRPNQRSTHPFFLTPPTLNKPEFRLCREASQNSLHLESCLERSTSQPGPVPGPDWRWMSAEPALVPTPPGSAYHILTNLGWIHAAEPTGRHQTRSKLQAKP